MSHKFSVFILAIFNKMPAAALRVETAGKNRIAFFRLR